jgi:hypothetical protein
MQRAGGANPPQLRRRPPKWTAFVILTLSIRWTERSTSTRSFERFIEGTR